MDKMLLKGLYQFIEVYTPIVIFDRTGRRIFSFVRYPRMEQLPSYILPILQYPIVYVGASAFGRLAVCVDADLEDFRWSIYEK